MKKLSVILFLSALCHCALSQRIGINKLFGGIDNSYVYSEQFNDIKQTPDGGYILVGQTPSSNTGTLVGQTSYGLTDAWVIKLDAKGNVEWQKLLGGNCYDILSRVELTTDGGYIAAGYTQSTKSGTLTGFTNNGGMDYWVVKLDASGGTQWQKLLGSAADDKAQDIKLTANGGYIVVGDSNGSNSGTLNGLVNNGAGTDAWIVKLDATGGLEWQTLRGGSSSDYAYSVEGTADGDTPLPATRRCQTA